MLTSGISRRVVGEPSALHGLKGNRLFKKKKKREKKKEKAKKKWGGKKGKTLAVFGKKLLA